MQQHISDTLLKLLNRGTKVSHLLLVTRVLFWIDDFPEGSLHEFFIPFTALCRDGIVWRK